MYAQIKRIPMHEIKKKVGGSLDLCYSLIVFECGQN